MRGYQLAVAILACLVALVDGQKCDANGVCDKLPQCTHWKEDGSCERNKASRNRGCGKYFAENDRTNYDYVIHALDYFIFSVYSNIPDNFAELHARAMPRFVQGG